NLMQNVVREQKRTLIMVTHDNTLAGFADKIIRIVDGKIVDMVDNTQNANAVSLEKGNSDTAGKAGE
ncbi:MAG: ABC transporter ATP-binding protein, partial [Lachnospiraceae bacterium]|nr:ABC transporter ATP-binding protein [Lachnospiraceae bacterium]